MSTPWSVYYLFDLHGSYTLRVWVKENEFLWWIVEKFYCSVRSAWTVNFHGNSVLTGNRYEETVFSRIIYHMSRLCMWNFIEKYWVLIIICYFTRKLCKSVNLTDSVFVGLKLHNKFNICNLSDWSMFLVP